MTKQEKIEAWDFIYTALQMLENNEAEVWMGADNDACKDYDKAFKFMNEILNEITN